VELTQNASIMRELSPAIALIGLDLKVVNVFLMYVLTSQVIAREEMSALALEATMPVWPHVARDTLETPLVIAGVLSRLVKEHSAARLPVVKALPETLLVHVKTLTNALAVLALALTKLAQIVKEASHVTVLKDSVHMVMGHVLLINVTTSQLYALLERNVSVLKEPSVAWPLVAMALLEALLGIVRMLMNV